MSFLESRNALALTLLVFTCLLLAPEAAAQEAGQAGQGPPKATETSNPTETPKPNATPTPLAVTGIDPYVASKDKGTAGVLTAPGKAGMGDLISVIIPGLSQAAKAKAIDPTRLVLFIDGQALKDIYPKSVGADNVVYKLERTSDSMDAWNTLLGHPRFTRATKPVVVSAGLVDQGPLPAYDSARNPDSLNKPNFKLIVYRWEWALIALGLLLVTVILFFKYGTTNLLRDSGPPNPPPGKLRPYSLAKAQVAWWFFIIVGSFLLIYLITGEFTMTQQALILMGIGTGTALGASMIDSSKRTSADNELETLGPQRARLKAELELLDQQIGDTENTIAANVATVADRESLQLKKVARAGKFAEVNTVNVKIANAEAGLQKPTSEGPWTDFVTDANGPSFHRFQMIVWTILLGILFLAGVYSNLAMPEFSVALLALMGISAGTYLGFKVPEQQNKAEQTMAEAAAATAATTTAQVSSGVPGTNGAGLLATTATTVDTTTAMDNAADALDGHDVTMLADTPDEDLPVTEGGVQ